MRALVLAVLLALSPAAVSAEVLMTARAVPSGSGPRDLNAVRIPAGGLGAYAVAILSTPRNITVAVSAGGSLFCQTDPVTAVCVEPLSTATREVTLVANQILTFSVFPSAADVVGGNLAHVVFFICEQLPAFSSTTIGLSRSHGVSLLARVDP